MFQIFIYTERGTATWFFGKFFFSFYFCLEIWCAGISQSPTRRALSNVFCADSLWAGSNKRSSIGSDKALSLLKSFHISSSSTRSCSWCSYNSLQKYTLHMHSLTYKTHQTSCTQTYTRLHLLRAILFITITKKWHRIPVLLQLTQVAIIGLLKHLNVCYLEIVSIIPLFFIIFFSMGSNNCALYIIILQRHISRLKFFYKDKVELHIISSGENIEKLHH